MADEDWKLLPDVPGLISKAPGIPQSLAPAVQSLNPPATKPSDDWVQPAGGGFGEEETGSSLDQSDAVTGELAQDAYYLRGNISQGPGQTILSGANYAQLGGDRGQSRFSSAFDLAPDQAREGMIETAQATTDEATALANHYKKQSENAAIMAADVQRRREQDDQELRRRESEIKDLTAKYSSELADSGKFWTKPSNIISAIAFTLAPLGSDDPTIGIRLLDNAIQGDLKNRKELANMHLGELRSNLSGYRQIAKDHEAGDMLAQSEAYRIAALQVEQIGQSFKGQKAKAAMKVMIADLLQKADLTAMEVFRKIYLGPQGMNPALAKEMMAQPGFVRYGTAANQQAAQGQGGQAATPQGQGAPGAPPAAGPPMATTGAAPTVYGKHAVVPGQKLGPGLTVSKRSDQPEGGPGRDSEMEKYVGKSAADILEGRSPGSTERVSQLDKRLTLQAIRLLGGKTDQASILKKKAEILFGSDGKGGVKAQIPEIEKSLQKEIEVINSYSRFQQDIRDIEAAAGGDGKKINDFIGAMRNVAPGSQQAFEDMMAKWGVGDNQARKVRAAAIRFRQALGSNVNSYFKDTSGGAVSDAEHERLKQVISMGSPWTAIQAFSKDLSQKKAARFNLAARNAVSDPIATEYFLIRMGQRHPFLNSPGKKSD